jgi:hypothetical protein
MPLNRKKVIDAKFIEGEGTIEGYQNPDGCPMVFGVAGQDITDWVEHSFRPVQYREDGALYALYYGHVRVTLERIAEEPEQEGLSHAGTFYLGCAIGIIIGFVINLIVVFT